MKISLIIPALNDAHLLAKQISALEKQSLLPNQVIIADSSGNDDIKSLSIKGSSKFELTYLRCGREYRFDRFFQTLMSLFYRFKRNNEPHNAFKNECKKYPAEAINIAANHAKYEILAFLDLGTEPEFTWLEDYYDLMILKKYDVIFGSTKYSSNTAFQKAIHRSTFGNNPLESNPGTLILKEIYFDNKILNGYRAGADLEWRKRIKQSCKWFYPSKTYLTYNSLPKNFFEASKKFFIYQLHGSMIRIQENVKDFVLSAFLVLMSFLVIKWNSFFDWNTQSFFYIPHITKIFLLTVFFFFIQFLILKRLNFFSESKSYRISSGLVKFLILIFFFLVSFRWNSIAANWVESSILYIPHITKIYFFTLVFSLILYRGVIFPLKNGFTKNDLNAINAINAGVVGTMLDIVKVPGFLLGSILYIFIKRHD